MTTSRTIRPVLPLASFSVTALSLPTRVYSFKGGSGVLYLLLIVVIAALTYVGLRAVRAQSRRPTTRVIGPDDDPEFLRRIS
jgi:hypothetical protein